LEKNEKWRLKILKISCNVTYRTHKAMKLVLCRVTLASALSFNVLLMNLVQSAGAVELVAAGAGVGATAGAGGVQVFGTIEAVHSFGIQMKTGLEKEYAVFAQV
jgi:hypothetical protein